MSLKLSHYDLIYAKVYSLWKFAYYSREQNKSFLTQYIFDMRKEYKYAKFV